MSTIEVANSPVALSSEVAGLDAVMVQAVSENFPVAMRLLPPTIRRHLLAIYGYARLVDDLGDEATGDRLALLDAARAELHAAFSGQASHPVFVRLQATVSGCPLEEATLAGLIEANRLDQWRTRYASFEELLEYCALSANPVGRSVLAVFGKVDATRSARSDEICSGLQVVEHLQDVGEDYAAGRIYIPGRDLERFGVTESDLGRSEASPALRRLVAFEAARARHLLEVGSALVGLLDGFARLAIAGFVGGGLAQLDAMARAGYDVLASPVKASKPTVLRRSFERWRRAGSAPWS